MPSGYHLVYSDDPSPTGWQRFDASAGGGWSHTFDVDEVYIASWQPYPYWAIEERVRELSHHQYVETDVIGQSQRGRDMYAIRISDPVVPESDTQDIVGLTRQHPGETHGSFRMDGAINYVLEVLESLRYDYTFHFIPAGNPDGIHNTIHRRTPDGTDLNRQWEMESPVEVENIKNYIRNNCDDIHRAFDYHSSTNSTYDAVRYYNTISDDYSDNWITEISNQNLSLSGTGRISEPTWSCGFISEELGNPAIVTENWTYYEYSVAEMEQEAVSSMQVVR